MAARVAEAEQIIAVDLHDHRLRTATEFGATHTVRGDVTDFADLLREITGGGANYAFDTTGVPDVMRMAMDVLRMTGICGYVGVQLGDLVLDPMSIVGKTMLGIVEGKRGSAAVHSAPHRSLAVRPLPVRQDDRAIPMSQINEAEQASLSGRVIKPVLIPGS